MIALPQILIINHEFPPIGGGAATAARNIAECMTAQGAFVTVLTSAYADLPAREITDGYAIIRIPALRRRAEASNVFEMSSFLFSALVWIARYGRSLEAEVSIAFFAFPPALRHGF